MASTIYATRSGFLYQDCYAILEFLTHYLARDLVEFHVDYPFTGRSGVKNQRSIDVRLILKPLNENGNIERVCGVKTGENFKKNLPISDKESTQIKEAFRELKEYASLSRPDNTALEMYMIIRPPLREVIAEVWGYLGYIDGRQVFTGNAKTAATRLYRKLGFQTDFPSAHEMFGFVKRVKVRDSYKDIVDSMAESSSPIDDAIIRKIEKIGGEFYADAAEYQMPSELLFSRLILECQKMAGLTNNFVPRLEEIMIDFFTKRKIIHKGWETDYKTTHDELVNYIKGWKKRVPVASATNQTVTSPTTSSEGEQI